MKELLGSFHDKLLNVPRPQLPRKHLPATNDRASLQELERICLSFKSDVDFANRMEDLESRLKRSNPEEKTALYMDIGRLAVALGGATSKAHHALVEVGRREDGPHHFLEGNKICQDEEDIKALAWILQGDLENYLFRYEAAKKSYNKALLILVSSEPGQNPALYQFALGRTHLHLNNQEYLSVLEYLRKCAALAGKELLRDASFLMAQIQLTQCNLGEALQLILQSVEARQSLPDCDCRKSETLREH